MPGDHGALRDLVVIFAVAVAVVVLFSRFRLPSIAGLLVAGILLGPGVSGLVSGTGTIRRVSEVGVVLLLFTLGLEFHLERLKSLWRFVLIGGSLQVALTVAGAAGIARLLGIPWPEALFLGFLVSQSSTAILLRALEERGETSSLQGRVIVGVNIFQDLAVVPMMLAVPTLAGGAVEAGEVASILLRAAAVLAGVLLGSRFLFPRVLGLVARTRSREAFVMTTLLVCLGIAWFTSLSGLSLALGAFLAGLAVARTDFGGQAMADVLPFRESLVALFFVSVGVLLDAAVLRDRPVAILAVTGGIVVLKSLLAAAAVLALGLPPRVAVLAGLCLAQVGEASLVLAAVGAEAGVFHGDTAAVFLNSAVLSMLVAPLLVRAAPHVARGVGRFRSLERLLGYRSVEEAPEAVRDLADHAVVCGYGVGGRLVSSALRRSGIPFVVLELNPDSVREGRVDGDRVFYGDASHPEVLRAAGIERASALLVLVSEPRSTGRVVRVARALAPGLFIVARTRLLVDADALRAEGASTVVTEEFEASVETLVRALRRAGIPREVIAARAEEARIAENLRRLRGLPPLSRVEVPDLSTEIVTLPGEVVAADWAAGRSLEEVGILRGAPAEAVALVRDGERLECLRETRLRAGDVVHLCGPAVAVARALETVRRGPRGEGAPPPA
jgi:CPA2 family monovalent cation:H+ antiporter-2